jgi:hypothetical protein
MMVFEHVTGEAAKILKRAPAMAGHRFAASI